MRLTLAPAFLLLTACLEPVDVGFNDAGRDAGTDGGTLVCTIGQDQTCNEVATMSALAGACSATGCVCLGGFERGPSGKCRPQNTCPTTPQQPGQTCSIPGVTCAYGYSPPECGGRTVRCEVNTWVEVMHSDPQGSCRDGGLSCLMETAPVCVFGTPGGQCGDAALQPACVSGAWQCPANTIPSTQCACPGLPPPGCTCTPTGWSCPPGDPCVPGSVRVSPSTLQFGTRPTGCRASLPLRLQNTCGVAQTVSLSAGGAPFFADGGAVLAPDASVTLSVDFIPQVPGAVTGVATVTATSGPVVVPLRGEGAFDVVDTFRQSARERVDLLAVVSDGPGMAPAQMDLAASGNSLVQYVVTSQIDLQMGVLRGRTDGGGLVHGSAGAPLVLTTITPNLAQRWSEKFLLGEAGSPTSSCLVRVAEHLAQDAGWLRADAKLSVWCIQNSYEQLSGTAASQVALLGQRAPSGEVVVSALANFTPACPAPDDPVLSAAVMMTGGVSSSICVDGGIGEPPIGSSYRRVFRLSLPVATDGGPAVSIDGMPLPPTDGRDAGVWSYDPARNAIVFMPLYVPEPGKDVSVRYRPVCGP
jgi:hypothetical protein